MAETTQAVPAPKSSWTCSDNFIYDYMHSLFSNEVITSMRYWRMTAESIHYNPTRLVKDLPVVIQKSPSRTSPNPDPPGGSYVKEVSMK